MAEPRTESARTPPFVEEKLSLRQFAETRFAALPMSLTAEQEAQLPLAVQHLLHELQARQKELELQNDELRRAQSVNNTARAHYFDFYDLAPVGYCTLNAEGQINQANLTMASLLGLMRDSLIAQLFSQFVVAQDQDIFYFFRQKLLESGESLSCDVRMARTGSQWFWVHLAALAVPGDDGITALRMVLSDITERKQTEEQLLLAASVFEHAGEGIMVTDVKGNIIEVNEAFTLITGYSRAEVLGRSPRMLRSGRHSADFYEAMYAQLASSGYWSGELWNRHKNGEVYPEQLAITAVRGPDGEVQRYVGLFSDITALKLHQQRLERMAYFDLLTGLPNRVLLADRMQQAMALARRSEKLLAVVYVDMDGFKAINDLHGHVAGDQMLIAVSMQMRDTLREGDTLARIGADEFAVILVGLESAQTCLPLLERLMAAVAQPLVNGDQTLRVTASLGVTFYPQAPSIEADQLLRQADQAMYQAKQAGKNCYQVFDAALHSSLQGSPNT